MPQIRTSASMVKRNTHVRSLAISAQSAVRREVISPVDVASKNPTSCESCRCGLVHPEALHASECAQDCRCGGLDALEQCCGAAICERDASGETQLKTGEQHTQRHEAPRIWSAGPLQWRLCQGSPSVQDRHASSLTQDRKPDWAHVCIAEGGMHE